MKLTGCLYRSGRLSTAGRRRFAGSWPRSVSKPTDCHIIPCGRSPVFATPAYTNKTAVYIMCIFICMYIVFLCSRIAYVLYYVWHVIIRFYYECLVFGVCVVFFALSCPFCSLFVYISSLFVFVFTLLIFFNWVVKL